MRPFLRRCVRPVAIAFAILSCRGDGPLAPQAVTPALDVAAAATGLVITEIMADPFKVPDARGEWFEVFNGTGAAIDLKDYKIVSNGGQTGTETHTIGVSVVVPALGFAVLGNNTDPTQNGGVTELYSYGTSITLANTNTGEYLELRNADNATVDLVAFGDRSVTPVGPPTYAPKAGISVAVIDESADNLLVGGANWKPSTETYDGTTTRDFGTPGRGPYGPAGPIVSASITPSPASVKISKTLQLTARAFDAVGHGSKTTTFTWSSSNETVATIDESGIASGLLEGTTTITATADENHDVKGTVTLTVLPPGIIASVSISINTPRQAPVGYTKPAFPTVRDAEGAVFSPLPHLTWTSSDMAVATVDGLGYITVVGEGTTTIKATSDNGFSGSLSFTGIATTAPTSAHYGNHVEFGTPHDGSDEDDYLITDPALRSQYALSYNKHRGGPNWVSANINATQFGAAPRCDCFSTDVTLPADFPRIVDFDYRNGGYDRGHMMQSEPRTTTDQENASTFLLSNILPQGAENNQGPWAQLEIYLNDLARLQGKEIYVIMGGEYSATPGTLKGEGKVAIPDYTWKVAVIMDGGKGLNDVHSTSDLQVIAVRMPNLTTPGVPASSVGIRNTPWQTFQTTVDAVEQKVGYDLLASLPDQIELQVESGDRPPVATVVVTPSEAAEGATVKFDGSTSSDPDVGDLLTYRWDFGDNTPTTGDAVVEHSYADNRAYTATLTVTDRAGVTGTATARVTVTNVAPEATFIPPSGIEGQSFTLSLTNPRDPSTVDGERLTYQFDCGDGHGFGQMDGSSSVACPTSDNGSRAVQARIWDKDGASSLYTGTVEVANVAPVAVWIVPAAVTEGQSFSLSLASAFDPSATDLAQLRYAFDCGDGRGLVDVGSSTSLVCTTSDEASRAVQARVSDKDGGATVYVGTVPVLNAAPVITGFETPRGPARTGSEVSLRLAYTDAGSADTHELVVDWGDGTSSMRIAGGSAEARHIYSAAGLYTISALVRDDDGGVASRSAAGYLVVYNPAGGFVTGGGWFASGRDIAPRSSGNGKVTVGFVARYGGDAAAGSLELQAHDQGLDFHGDAVEWLVVRGDRSTFKGTGTVRGRPGTYGFLVTAIDGDVAATGADQLRVKIWDASDRVIFDNRPAAADGSDAATPLGGGSVVLHER